MMAGLMMVRPPRLDSLDHSADRLEKLAAVKEMAAVAAEVDAAAAVADRE